MNGAVSSVAMRYGSIPGVMIKPSKIIQRFYSRCSSMEHPFFKLSKMEQFHHCYSEQKASLANGAMIFPICIDDLSGMSRQLKLSSINLSNKREINNWLQHYRERCAESNKNHLIPVNTSNKPPPPVYITKEKYPQLNEIVELFEANTLNTTDPVALNSLIDYTLLNNHSGLFAENIYTFLLQNYGNSIDGLNLIVNSIRLHLNSKLDYFPDIENIVSKILVTVNTLPLNTDITTFDRIFQDLLSGTVSRFSLETNLSGFNNTVLTRMLEYQLFRRKNTIEAKILFSLLLEKHIRPSDEVICQYLNLLNEKTSQLEPIDAKLQKLIYLSGFRALIEDNPPLALIEFLIPLCDTTNELRNVVDIIKKQDDKILETFDKVLSLLIKQYILVSKIDRTVFFPVALADFYYVINHVYNGNIPETYLKEIVIRMVSRESYGLATTIIENHPTLKNPNFLKKLIDHLVKAECIEQHKFINHFNLSLKQRSNISKTI